MASPVVTTTADAAITDIADLMLKHKVSALPVLDADGQVIGIVSEGDLIQRDEIGTLPHRSWWLSALGTKAQLADEFIKSHGATASAVMTANVLTVSADTPLQEIAEILERKKVKRLPILEDGKLVGIVSRANLLQALAIQRGAAQDAPSPEDRDLRQRFLDTLKGEPWANSAHLNVIAKQGVLYLWGQVRSQKEREALVLAAKETPGVKDVVDHTDRSVTVY
ncbi:MAG: CBS domain-containing protein [Alphaproteobacteria bacterium]|nr:CBS domain-containing protein [Alphaproteobacteria bacterium]